MRYLLFLILLWSSSILSAQSLEKPEAQISFAKENRSLDYYVAQAHLWWLQIEKAPKEEMAWWNYYRACRNVQGSYNWSADFVNLGPNLLFGDSIVSLMESAIPNTFIYHFVKGSTKGVDPSAGPHLLKAFEMNPDFPGLLPAVVSFAISTHNDSLRMAANRRWFENQGFNANWMDFAYNLLQSVGKNGILFTQGDNDSYPVWMLQDALGIRSDVKVVNIDFLLFDGFQKPLFESLGLAPFDFAKIDPDIYESNWTAVCTYFLENYRGARPVQLSYTVNRKFYSSVPDHLLYPRGLTYQYAWEAVLVDRNLQLFRADFRLNSLEQSLVFDPSAARLKELNRHYRLFFETLEKEHQLSLSPSEMEVLKSLEKNI